MKRFTETLKWQDPWFRCLSAPAKMLWFYMLDHCDHIGLVEISFKLASMDCGLTIKPEHAEELGDRIQAVDGGKYFIRQFISFQYGTLSSGCIPHRKVIESVRVYGLSPTLKGYAYPSPRVADRVSDTLLDKEEDKDKEEEKDKASTRARGTLEELTTFCEEIGATKEDGEHLFYHWQSNGWKAGTAAIKDWKAAVRKWKSGNYLPSQKAGTRTGNRANGNHADNFV